MAIRPSAVSPIARRARATRPASVLFALALVVGAGASGFSAARATAVPPAPVTFSGPSRIGFPGGDDWEPSIAADRYGHVYVLMTHYLSFKGGGTGDPDPTCVGCGSPHMVLQVSSDGGATFSAPRAPFPTLTRQDDPQIAVDPADGRTLYASYMEGNKSSQHVARSDDFGATWRTMLVEPLRRGTDKDILAVRGGNVYLVYHTQEKIFASSSHDGGRTWSFTNMLGTTNSTLGVSLPSGGAVAPGDGQTVLFAWNGINRPGQAKGTINLYVTKSTDGGLTWTTSLVDVSQAAPDCGCGGWDFWGAQMALGIDAAGTIDVLWNANRVQYGPQRVFFARSVNGGATWSTPTDVSNARSGTNHAFPALVAGATGDVRIAWMDDRNGFDPGGATGVARWNTYSRSSTDGGATWSPERRLSAYVPGYAYKLATPAPGFLQPYGDYMELDVTGAGKTVATWGEGPSYNGPGNIWFAAQQ